MLKIPKPPQLEPQNNFPSKFLLIIISIILLIGVGFILNKNLYGHQQTQLASNTARQNSESQTSADQSQQQLTEQPTEQTEQQLSKDDIEDNASTTESRLAHYDEEENNLTPRPDSWMSAPFTPQAPTANWDELHNEACEEASSIMVAAFLSQNSTNGDGNGKNVNITPKYIATTNPPDQYFLQLDPKFVESEITKLTKWQDNNLGYHLSIDTYQTARMISEVYNLDTQVVPYDLNKIKKVYGAGERMIIVPTNGRLLKNPYYKAPGPIYHMLVLTGYNPTQLITNDSGTKRGYNYVYNQAIVQKAAGNWDADTGAVDLTNKLMIIVSRK